MGPTHHWSLLGFRFSVSNVFFYISKWGVQSHQTFQVPKMRVLNLIRLFWGWVSPYISLHTAYIGEYLHFRYLQCLVTICWGERFHGAMGEPVVFWMRLLCWELSHISLPIIFSVEDFPFLQLEYGLVSWRFVFRFPTL